MEESDWKKMLHIIVKYNLPIKARGYSAKEIAKEIKEKYFEKLNDEEKKEVESLV